LCYMYCPSRRLLGDHCNYIWRRVQAVKLLMLIFSVLQILQPSSLNIYIYIYIYIILSILFQIPSACVLPLIQRPSSTFIQDYREKYNSVYFCFYVFR
jgi:hypothetical protein